MTQNQALGVDLPHDPGLVGAQDLEPVLRRIVTNAVEVSAADVATLYLYDEYFERFYCPIGVGMRHQGLLESLPLPRPDGIAAQVIASTELLIANSREECPELFRAFAQKEGLLSAVGLPLYVDAKAVGILFISSRREHWPAMADLRVLRTYGELAALAVAKAREIERLFVLNEAGRAINSMLETADLVRQVYEATKRVLMADAFTISLAREGRDTVYFYAIEKGKAREESEHVPGKLSQWVLESKKPCFVSDVTKQTPPVEPSFVKLLDESVRPKSYIFLPLVFGDRLHGVVSVQAYRPGALSEEHRQILEVIASHTAIALENARRLEELKVLRQVGQEIVESIVQDPKQVFERIAKCACDVTGADCAVIYPYDAHRSDVYDLSKVAAWGTRMEPRLADRPRGSGGMAAYIAATGTVPIESRGDYEDLLLRGKLQPQKEGESFLDREGIQAFVGISLRVGAELVGILYVNYRRAHAFDENELQTIQIFGHQAAIAIQNARLLERTSLELQRKVNELAALSDIDRAILGTATSDDLDKALDKIVAVAMRISDAPLGGLMLLDSKADELVLLAVRGGDIPKGTRIPTSKGITGWVAQHRRSVLIEDVTADRRWGSRYEELFPCVRSELAVPMLAEPTMGKGDVIGVLNVESDQVGRFDVEDQRLLETLASQAVIAIQSVQRYEMAQKARRRLEVVMEVDALIGSTLDLEHILDSLTQKLGEVVDAPDRGVLLYDGATDELVIHSTAHYMLDEDKRGMERIPVGDGRESVVAWVALHREPYLVLDVSSQSDPKYLRLISRTRSELVAPIVLVQGAEQRLVGVFNLESPDPHAFDEDDRLLLEAISMHAAQAIQNAERYEAQRQLVDKLDKVQEERIRLEALEAIGDLGKQLAHRMSNIAGSTPVRVDMIRELLRCDPPDQQKILRHLDSIDADARSLLSASHQIRRMTQTHKREAIDFNDIVDTSLTRMHASMGTGVSLSVDLEPELGLVSANSEQLIGTTVNLISNALDALNDAGELTIQTRNIISGGISWVELTVSDTGKGISDKELPKVFDLFYTTKPGGLGFGLWRDRKVIEALEGEIILESARGVGTVARVRLPKIV